MNSTVINNNDNRMRNSNNNNKLHSFVCRRAPGRSARHHALNDLIARSFASAGVPGVTGCTIPRHRLYPGLNRARLDYTPGILCPRPVHTPGYELA